MSDISIGTNILHLRKEKALTQEQLASMIGVSAGAVSKWETGNSKPDIDLLAPLARALNTSLNELLSFKEELEEEEIKKIKKELADIFLHQGFSEGEKMCKEYLSKYPNSAGLKLNIAGLIQMYSMLLGDKFKELIIIKQKYALALLYGVVDSKESKYLNTALFLIANIQISLEDYEESERCLKELMNSFIDPMVIYASLLERQGKNNQVESLCKRMLLSYMEQSRAMMCILSRTYKNNNNFEKAVLYLEAVSKIESIFKTGLSSGAYNLCRLYIEKGEMDKAAKYFKNYVEDLISIEYDYNNNPYFENLKLEIESEGQKIIRKKLYETLIEEEDTKVLSKLPEYNEAIDKLKAAMEE
ncbi:helix-turn-helix domain-containing protein [Clostridium omnivorum]|uniref:Transcriptional regulator n=1 Tax=Clostridium omnivorum TaxID=1604902 RepID=A0ABQ5N5P6_9CLOT|nr:helix-turn-helix transcriptional regulator [Clostridium sp. E14]GLC30558.1 transcriptional regulator [Clostridium sp. E14]